MSRASSRRSRTLMLTATAVAAGLSNRAFAATVSLNSSESYVQPSGSSGVASNPGALSNGQTNASTNTWSFSSSNTAPVWSDGLNDNPAVAANYINSSSGTTNAASNVYTVTGTSSSILSINSPYLALGASTTFYGNSLNLTYTTLNLNTIYDAGSASTNTYNFTNLNFNNSSIAFNDYYGSLTKVVASPIVLSGTNTFNSSRGSYTEAESFTGAISGSGTLAFGFSGGSTRTITISNTANTFTGAVNLGSTSGASTFTLTHALGNVSTYTVGTSWTLVDSASNNINGSNMAVTGLVQIAGTNETFGNLTGAGTVTATSSSATTLTLTGAGTFSGVLNNGGGALSVTKTGNGNQILSGAASYTGTTTINAGTLTLGNSFTGSGPVNLNGGTLASGTATAIAGLVTANTSANTIAPGGIGSVGALTLANVTTSAATTFNMDLGTGTGIITNGDLVNFTNAPTLASTTLLAFNNSATSVIGNDYRLFGGSIGGISTSAFTLPSAPLGQAYSVSASVDPGYIDLVVSSTAQGLFWDNAGTGGGDGLTWDNAMLNWNNSTTGLTNFNSSNADNVTFNDTNNGNYNVQINTTLTPGSTTVSALGNYNFSGSGGIGGSGFLAMIGTGTLNLATANTFTGATNLSSGTLNLQNTLAVQNSTVNLLGGTLTFDPVVSANAFILGGLTGSGNITLANTASLPITLSVGNNNSSTGYSGVLSGPGVLNKIGSGVLTVSGSNTYTGGTTITAGELNVGSAENAGTSGPLGAWGPITFAGGSLQYSGSNQFDYSSRFNTSAGQNFSIDTNGYNVTYATGLNSSGGSLTKLGAGMLTLGGSSLYTGATNISGGTLQLGIATAVPASSTIRFLGTSTFDLNNLGPITVPAINVSSGASATLANGTVNTNDLVFTAASGGSNISGGTINMSAGIIDASAAGGTSVASSVVTAINTQITGTGGLTIKSFGNISDNGGGNSAQLTLANPANSFTGGVAITQGMVNVIDGDGIFNNATSASTNVVTISPSAGFLSSGTVTLNTASIVLSGAGNHYMRIYGSQTLTLNGVISDGGAGAGLYKTDSGTLTLAGSNTYTGTTTVNDGTVNVNGNESAATGSWIIGSGTAYTTTVNFASGSIIDVASGKVVNIGTIPGGTVVSSVNQTLNVATAVTNAGSLSIGRSGYLNINSGAIWSQTGAMSVEPVAASGYSAYLQINSGGLFSYNGSTPINAAPSVGNGGYGEILVAGGTFNTNQGIFNSVVSGGGTTGEALVSLTAGGTLGITANIPNLTGTSGSTFVFSLGSGSGGIINTNGFNTTIGTVVSNATYAGVLQVTGGGSVTLTGANTFNGSTSVLSGTVYGGSNASFGTSIIEPVASVGNASVLINGPYTIANTITVLATSPYVATIGGSTDSNAVLSGPIALAQNGTFTQVTNAGTNALNISGGITSGNPGTQTATFAGPGNILVSNKAIANNLGTLAVAVTGGNITFSPAVATPNTYTGGTNVTGGTLNLAGSGAFPAFTSLSVGPGTMVNVTRANSSQPVTVTQISTLANSGLININSNALVIQNPPAGTIATIASQLQSAYNSGNWNGTTGITSSTAGAETTHLTAIGVLINDTGANTGSSTGTPLYTSLDNASTSDGDVLVKYAYYGDANLSGAVDGSDYSLIDNGVLNNLTGWYNGDFNYDGIINGSDYTLIDNTFNTQGASLAAQLASPTAQIASGTAAVPEPATLGLIGVGTIGLLGRRRRVK